MTESIVIPTLVILTILYAIYRRFTRISIADVPGPEAQSFLLGNLPELFQSQAGEADFKWQGTYKDIVRIRGPFGEDRLWISDPKALQYIYQTSGYNYPKAPERREMSRVLMGRGLVWAEGEDHKRHRKVMLPGFGAPEMRAFVPLFANCSARLCNQWKDTIISTSEQSSVFDVPGWLSRAFLDAIGEAAFDYQFGAMDHTDNALGKAYSSLLPQTFGSRSKASIFVQDIARFLPESVLQYLTDHVPSEKLQHARDASLLATRVAKDLVDSKAEDLIQGRGHRDVMSLLVKANASANENTKLNEEEVLSQMRTIMLAGHETTANTLSWTLLELARNPKFQTTLRNEIRATEQAVLARGDSEFNAGDFENMPYLQAVLKESLRFHPVAFNSFRNTGRDDVLPLSTPIRLTTGEVVHELPIPKGLKLILSIAAYNRNKDVFGEDAHTFNPDRWLNRSSENKGTNVGVYANLLTFAGGIRACIGWRFAVLELQTFLADMIKNFEFELTDKSMRIRRESALVMVPTVEGEVQKGTQLPLRVRIAAKD